ncbi:MAG: SRPBCC domain-containing protein [Bacteroidota bacterium]
METTKQKTNTGNYKTVSIQRKFDLPIDKVWSAWTTEDGLKKWWGPKAYSCPVCHVDFKVGGKYLASMMHKDKGDVLWSTGVYKEIIPQKKIVMTDSFSDSNGNVISAFDAGMPGVWPQELIITVELKEDHGKTYMTLTQEPMPAEMYDDCIKGWNECLDKLEEI